MLYFSHSPSRFRWLYFLNASKASSLYRKVTSATPGAAIVTVSTGPTALHSSCKAERDQCKSMYCRCVMCSQKWLFTHKNVVFGDSGVEVWDDHSGYCGDSLGPSRGWYATRLRIFHAVWWIVMVDWRRWWWWGRRRWGTILLWTDHRVIIYTISIKNFEKLHVVMHRNAHVLNYSTIASTLLYTRATEEVSLSCSYHNAPEGGTPTVLHEKSRAFHSIFYNVSIWWRERETTSSPCVQQGIDLVVAVHCKGFVLLWNIACNSTAVV